MVVKKYGNRRLYDTESSRYITLEELASLVRGGADVRVLDARTGEDLTRATLAQIIMESRGAGMLLPSPLLVQLVRLGDDAFTEFFGRWVTWALEMYLQMRPGMRDMPWNPFGQGAPWSPGAAPFFPGFGPWTQAGPPPPSQGAAAAPPPPAPPPPAPPDDVAMLRREIEDLRQSLRKTKK